MFFCFILKSAVHAFLVMCSIQFCFILDVEKKCRKLLDFPLLVFFSPQLVSYWLSFCAYKITRNVIAFEREKNSHSYRSNSGAHNMFQFFASKCEFEGGGGWGWFIVFLSPSFFLNFWWPLLWLWRSRNFIAVFLKNVTFTILLSSQFLNTHKIGKFSYEA